MAQGLAAVQRHAIFTGTKKFGLGMRAAMSSLNSDSTMTASHQHRLAAAGTCSMQGQQRCVAMRPVIFSVWNKKTGAGKQN
jgi:hypothetical protein